MHTGFVVIGAFSTYSTCRVGHNLAVVDCIDILKGVWDVLVDRKGPVIAVGDAVVVVLSNLKHFCQIA